MPKTYRRTRAAFALPILAVLAGFPTLGAQAAPTHPEHPPSDSARMAGMADDAMSGPMSDNMIRHMQLSPLRPATHADSIRATDVAAQLKRAIAKYQDTTAAVADGYRLFAPNLKNQAVFHFTNYGHGFKEAFRFDPAQPTSILYKRGSDGKLHLVGAMYTMPKNSGLDRLNARIPLSVARWHKHVNWCVPHPSESKRWSETTNGAPVFGPASPIATRAECDAVHGRFLASPLGWMVHANVFEGNDLATIWGDDHHGGEHHPMSP